MSSITEIRLETHERVLSGGVVLKYDVAHMIVCDLHFYMDIRSDRDTALLSKIQAEIGCPLFDCRK